MPLVKKPVLTEEELAANRRNAGQSLGAVTEEGKARIGAAQFRHGFYSKKGKAQPPQASDDGICHDIIDKEGT
jgi:hypothetical protein